MATQRGFFAQILQFWREITTVVLAIGGWFCITWALAGVFDPGLVWKASIGLFCLGLVGFKLLWKIFSLGLYTLSQAEDTGSSTTSGE